MELKDVPPKQGGEYISRETLRRGLPYEDGINVDDDPFVYNKDFDPNNPDHFEAWVAMKPNHIGKPEWLIAVGELELMLQSPSAKEGVESRSMTVLGWKSKHALLPEQK